MRFRKDKLLVQLTFEDRLYSMRATAHARERMVTRDVEEYTVIGNIVALGEERLKDLQDTQEEAVIVDERNDVAIVVAFEKNTINIVTVFDGSNIWNNRGTHMIKITDYGVVDNVKV